MFANFRYFSNRIILYTFKMNSIIFYTRKPGQFISLNAMKFKSCDIHILSLDLPAIISDVIHDLLHLFFILVIWVRLIDNQINYRLVNYVLRDMIVFCVTYECSSRHNKGCGLLVLSSFLRKIECEEICVKFLSLKGFYK